MCFFFCLLTIFWFMAWLKEKSKIPSVKTLNSNISTKLNKNVDFIQCSDLFKLVHIYLDNASFAYLTFQKT